MGQLLIEYLPFKPVITESKNRPGIMEVTGVMQRAGAKNLNGRVYDRDLLERECQKYIKEFVETGTAYGELDHPESAVVSLKNTSHIVTQLWWKGNDLMGKVEILPTPAGNIVKNIIQRGYTIGISSRGTGSVTQVSEGTLAVEDDFELICWDFVSNPSTHGAFMRPGRLNEGRKVTTNKYHNVNSIIREIICATTNVCDLN